MEYVLDRHDRLVRTSADWDRFALANEGSEVIAENVQGRAIHTFIQSDLTRMWFDTLLQLARVTERPIEREYRCDSPTHRRFMLMKLAPLEERAVLSAHDLLRIEEREHPTVYVPAQASGVQVVRCCSVCHKLRFPGSAWEEADPALGRRPQRTEPHLQVAYTVCEACQADMNRPESGGLQPGGAQPR